MTAHRFSEETRFRWEGCDYRVVRRLPDGKLNLEDLETHEVMTFTIKELTDALFVDDLRFSSLLATSEKQSTWKGSRVTSKIQQHIYPTLDDCSPVEQAVAKYRIWVIKPLLILGRKRTANDVDERVKAVKEMIEAREVPVQQMNLDNMPKLSVSMKSIYRWIKDYESSGSDPRALIPKTRLQGGKGKSYMGVQVEAIMRTTVEEMALRRIQYTIDDVHDEIYLRVMEFNETVDGDQHKPPSRSTVARRIEKLGYFKRFAAKRGKKAAYYELSQFGEIKVPKRPLGRVEIDHTKIDVIVVDEETQAKLGRPTLTMCIDTTTRYPLGYYLGFEPPSYYTVMQCLYHAIMPKQNVRERYGTTNDWVAYGMPRILVIDNGKEFIGNDLEDACNQLGIHIQNTPAYTPHLKAIVERQFGTLNTGVFHKATGTTFSNIIEKGDYDSLKEAKVSLSMLDKVIHLFLVDVYGARPHKGLGGIPLNRWRAYETNGFEPRLPASAHELKMLLGSIEYRTVRRDGIELFRLRYNCDELSLLRTRVKNKKVKVKYNRGDLSHIHVYDPFENRYITVPALAQAYTQGLSLWMHRVIRNEALKELGEYNVETAALTKRKIHSIVDDDLADKKRKTRSKSARWGTQGKSAQELAWGDDVFNEQVADAFREGDDEETYQEIGEFDLRDLVVGDLVDENSDWQLTNPLSDTHTYQAEVEAIKPSKSAKSRKQKRNSKKSKSAPVTPPKPLGIDLSFSDEDLEAFGFSADDALPTTNNEKTRADTTDADRDANYDIDNDEEHD